MDWKLTAAQDLAARGDLFESILEAVKRDADMPVVSDLSSRSGIEPCLTPYYLVAIYDQALLQAVGKQDPEITRDSFRPEEGGVLLRGFRLVNGGSKAQVDRAIDLFLKLQTEIVGSEQAKVSADTYHKARSRTTQLKQHLRRIRLSPGLPPGSVCDGCKAWSIQAS